MEDRQPVLFLLPVPVSEAEFHDWLGEHYKSTLKSCSLFLVENARTARRFISSLRLGLRIEDLRFEVVDKDTSNSMIQSLTEEIIRAERAILMSESGCPGVADPGAALVCAAHEAGIRVEPFVGPSSILLALMGSGLSGQNFTFHGYLPVKEPELVQCIDRLEKESKAFSRTQIFIETPYRNNSIWTTLLARLNSETRLCIAFDLLGPDQRIEQMLVRKWRQKGSLKWIKKPAVFLFQAE